MKISTRGRYALRMMLDMALSDSDKPVRVKEYPGSPAAEEGSDAL